MRSLRRLLAVLAVTLVAAGIALLLRSPPPPVSRPSVSPPPISGSIDRILIEKSARRLTLFQRGAAVRQYRVALGFSPEGDKVKEGDGRTPEGLFRIDRRNDQSAYHLSLGLDYPRPAHVAAARAGGYSPGGDIFIHGQPNLASPGITLRRDWTAGCIALSDAEIEEIWSVTPIGTEVEILP